MHSDLYALLGIRPSANQIEIRDAYRSAMRAAHPDRATSDADRARRTARSAALNGAYEVLGDPDRRAAYDLSRAAAAPAPAPRPTPAASAPAAPLGIPVAPRGRRASFRASWTDLAAFPGAFAGYLALPLVSPGTTPLAGAAWGALLTLVAVRLAAGDGQVTGFVERLRRR